MSEVSGRAVTTIEGLSPDSSHPLQKAWLAENVPQCGYCQSGQIMSAADLLRQHPKPSREQIVEHMSTNICRCGTYPRIREAIRRAGRVTSGHERIAAAPPPGIDPADAAREVPALREIDASAHGAEIED